MTNGDKIRQMDDEELAAIFNKIIQDCEYCPLYEDCIQNTDATYVTCKVMYLKWLREEVQENG